MGTPLQDDANRRNGRLSNGPKSPAGKAISRRNSLKHGLLAREVLLPDEDAASFALLAKSLREALDPVGALEVVLAERIIGLVWRLRRLGKIEAGILACEMAGVMIQRAKDQKELTTKRAGEDRVFTPASAKDREWLATSGLSRTN